MILTRLLFFTIAILILCSCSGWLFSNDDKPKMIGDFLPLVENTEWVYEYKDKTFGYLHYVIGQREVIKKVNILESYRSNDKIFFKVVFSDSGISMQMQSYLDPLKYDTTKIFNIDTVQLIEINTDIMKLQGDTSYTGNSNFNFSVFTTSNHPEDSLDVKFLKKENRYVLDNGIYAEYLSAYYKPQSIFVQGIGLVRSRKASSDHYGVSFENTIRLLKMNNETFSDSELPVFSD